MAPMTMAGNPSSPGRGRSLATLSSIVAGLLFLALIGMGIYSHSLAVTTVLGTSPFPRNGIDIAYIDDDHNRGKEEDGRTRSPRSPPVLDGTVEEVQRAEIVWQIPSNPSGVLFLAHGCYHKATDFWDQSPKCPDCYGWPEDRNVTLAALDRGLAVLAMSSHDLCWDAKWPPESGVDVKRAILMLQTWRAQKGLDKLPLFGFGASSGGYFVSVLAHRVKFEALAIQIASGVRMAFERDVIIDEVEYKYPPTLFVHMPSDKHTAAEIEESMRILREQGVEVMDLRSNPRPITPNFFAESIEKMDALKSQQIHKALKKDGQLDESGFLIHDPRRFGWKTLLRDAGILRPLPDALNRPYRAPAGHVRFEYERDIAEELNLAFGRHELIGDFNDDMLDWFFGVCRRDGQLINRRCNSEFEESKEE